ncbi:MAG: YggS family pyridoxal phosphate-dependent enzyme [Clostridia bacterium]|nr:YggS family pyridoxal phosphate-dependent enzyme [Clostridia bacterium]
MIDNIIACRRALDEVSDSVEILAVTKNHEASVANLAYEAGIMRIGENRVQELMQKLPMLNPLYSIDLIGQLQTNKVKYILNAVSRVQSLDRMSLALEIDKRCKQAGIVMPCLVEVRMDKAEARAGVEPDELADFIKEASRLRGISIEGLMAVMPIADDPEDVRPLFRRMRQIFERERDRAIDGVKIECLSMGMSHDYLVAAQEGATQVRLGSVIFGSR